MANKTPPVNQYQTPFGTFKLRRYPARRNEQLRAWNNSDTLLLEAVKELGWSQDRALVINDEHGALTLALQPLELWTDSYLSAIAVDKNLRHNGLSSPTFTWSTSCPRQAVDFAVMRIPKQLAYFEYQLAVLSTVLPKGARLLAAGMDKHLSPRTAEILEQHFGPTERHPGKRRARVFQAVNSGSREETRNWHASYPCQQLGSTLTALPNVFSHDRVDIGSRLLLDNLEVLDPITHLVDLACGNGLLGLAAFASRIASRVSFCDESAMAVQSARENCQRLYPASGEEFAFFHADGLIDYSGESPEAILCNPPFHTSHTVDTFIGRRLVTQAAKQLAPGGKLLLVANRHLDYGQVLRSAFRQVERVCGDRKFNLWLATKG